MIRVETITVGDVPAIFERRLNQLVAENRDIMTAQLTPGQYGWTAVIIHEVDEA